MPSSGRGLVKGLAFLVSGRVASVLVGVVSTAVLARLLTPGDYGLMAAAFVVLALGNVIFDGAFGVNVVRRLTLRAEDIPTTATAAVLLGMALAAIVIATAPLVEALFGFAGLASILMWCAPTLPLKAISSVAGAVLQRQGKFAGIAAASICGQIAGYVIFAIPLALLGASVWSLVVAMVVAGVVEAVWLARAAGLTVKPSWHADTLRDIRGAGLFSAANILNWAANTSANAIVGTSLSALDLGFYSRGWKLLDLFVAATSTPLSRVLLPFFASRVSEPQKLGRSFTQVLDVVLPGYAAVSVLFVLQAPLIVAVALGPQWQATIPVVQFLFAALLPRCAYKVSEIFAVANGRSMATFVRQGIYAGLMVICASIGVQYGVNGVAAAVSIAIAIFYITSMIYAMAVARISVASILAPHCRAAGLALLVGAVDVAILWLTQNAPELLSHTLAGLGASIFAFLALVATPRLFLGPETGPLFGARLSKALRDLTRKGRNI